MCNTSEVTKWHKTRIGEPVPYRGIIAFMQYQINVIMCYNYIHLRVKALNLIVIKNNFLADNKWING